MPTNFRRLDGLPLHEAARVAGNVTRYHTHPAILGRQSVAEHTYNCLALLFTLYPGEPPLDLVRAVLFHDLPEGETGDIPATAKWSYPALKDAADAAEYTILRRFGLDLDLDLSTEDRWWLKVVDILELCAFCRDQRLLGNRGIDNVWDAGVGVMARLLDDDDGGTPNDPNPATLGVRGAWDDLRAEYARLRAS